MGRTRGVCRGKSWGESSGQQSKAFCSIGTNSLCRAAFVIGLEQSKACGSAIPVA